MITTALMLTKRCCSTCNLKSQFTHGYLTTKALLVVYMRFIKDYSSKATYAQDYVYSSADSTISLPENPPSRDQKKGEEPLPSYIQKESWVTQSTRTCDNYLAVPPAAPHRGGKMFSCPAMQPFSPSDCGLEFRPGRACPTACIQPIQSDIPLVQSTE